MGSEPVRDWRTIANNLGKASAGKDLRIAALEAELAKAHGACREAMEEMQRGIQSMREIREENGELRESEQRLLTGLLSLARKLGPNEAHRPAVTAAAERAEVLIDDLRERLARAECDRDQYRADAAEANAVAGRLGEELERAGDDAEVLGGTINEYIEKNRDLAAQLVSLRSENGAILNQLAELEPRCFHDHSPGSDPWSCDECEGCRAIGAMDAYRAAREKAGL